MKTRQINNYLKIPATMVMRSVKTEMLKYACTVGLLWISLFNSGSAKTKPGKDEFVFISVAGLVVCDNAGTMSAAVA